MNGCLIKASLFDVSKRMSKLLFVASKLNSALLSRRCYRCRIQRLPVRLALTHMLL